MNRDEIIEILSDGKITGITFVKRTDGSIRKMRCRLGVFSYLKGGTKPYDDAEKNLVTVFDMDKLDYRAIPVESILSFRKKGNITVLRERV